MTEIAPSSPSSASAAAPAGALAPEGTAGQAETAKPIKLDWSRVAPPRNLASARVEELSIDGICGVY